MNKITKNGVRVLRPSEFEKLKRELKTYQKHQLRGLLLTGMRYIEARRLQQNPDWFDGKFIQIPDEGSRKDKMRYKERTIKLSSLGEELIPLFLETKNLPSNNGWNENLKRWAEKAGIGKEGISAKTTRKTWVSWLMTKYPKLQSHIFISMGHSKMTSIEHYLNMPFTERDKEAMEKYTAGWQ